MIGLAPERLESPQSNDPELVEPWGHIFFLRGQRVVLLRLGRNTIALDLLDHPLVLLELGRVHIDLSHKEKIK